MSENLHEKRLITRKQHKCFGCKHMFPKGTEMRSSACACDGTIFNTYLCATCEEYISRHRNDLDEEYYEGELYYNDPEEWDEIDKELKTKVQEGTKG